MGAMVFDELAIAALAALEDPTRRQLYAYVSSQHPREVGRDEAAQAIRISRGLAAFHLDKLVENGLLPVCYRRLSERRGPGAGRPAKLYIRAQAGIELTLPHREYVLVGRILAKAIVDRGNGHASAVNDV